MYNNSYSYISFFRYFFFSVELCLYLTVSFASDFFDSDVLWQLLWVPSQEFNDISSILLWFQSLPFQNIANCSFDEVFGGVHESV